jgi:epsilon-lactone hydrolase
MKPIRDAIGRTMLTPALRLMRAQMKLISDPVRLREMAARVDALAGAVPDVQTEAVSAGGVPANWVQMARTQPDGVLLYLHGGAFVAETPRFHGALLARLCGHAGARGLMPGYRLAPEHRYPAALDDCLAAYRWLLAQGHDASRIVVAGDSAGGNLALALLLRARSEGLQLPAGVVALSPVTDLTFSGDSVQRNDGVDDMFSADLMHGLVPMYLSDPALRTHPHVSPLFGDLTGLPPLLLIVGSTELLLDDSVRVAQRCPSAQLLVWHGMPHVFPGFDFLPEASAAVQRVGAFVRECIDRVQMPRGAPSAPERARTTADETQRATSGPAQAAAGAAPRATSVGQAATRPASAPATGALRYLVLALLSGLLTPALLVVWPGALQLVTHPLLWATSATLLVFIYTERESVGQRRWPWCALATLALGPACGLSLFLYLRGSRRTEGATR